MSDKKNDPVLELPKLPLSQLLHGDWKEPARARAQNRAPDVPRGQQTPEQAHDVMMGRRDHRER